MAGSTVLVVDDERNIVQLAKLYLRNEGYQVETAANGREALDCLARVDCLPFIVLLDLMMPVMDGWTFWAELRANPRWASLPVVVISADANVKEKAARLEPLAALRKPIRFEDLLSIVQRCHKSHEPHA